MALKLRREAGMFTNGWPPQKTGAASFKRVLGGAHAFVRIVITDRQRTTTVRSITTHCGCAPNPSRFAAP